jgi:hypothetical protein
MIVYRRDKQCEVKRVIRMGFYTLVSLLVYVFVVVVVLTLLC